MFKPSVEVAARAHALREWPREAVGFVIGDRYVGQSNLSTNPVHEYAIDSSAWSDDVQAVIHSHTTDFDCAPSATDMRVQIAADVPFGILATDGKTVTPLLWLGDHVLDEPLIGRSFVHGVTDCYELVRAWMWQSKKIKLKSVPREQNWWDTKQNLIVESMAAAGCVRIAIEEVVPGDGLLMAIPLNGIINHCAVLLDDNMMIHHRAGQLSRREPWSGLWRRVTRMAVRV